MLDGLHLSAQLDAAQPLTLREQALDRLVTTATSSLIGFVRARGAVAEAEDIVNETWMRVCASVLHGHYHHQGHPVTAYVLAVAKYVIHEWQRNNQARTHHECDWPADLDVALAADPIAAWEAATDFAEQIAALAPSDEEQRLLQLLLEEYSFPAIAQELQISVSSVRRSYKKLLTACRERYVALAVSEEYHG